jgi:hypothetical protein
MGRSWSGLVSFSLTYLLVLSTNKVRSHCAHRSGNSRCCCKYRCGSICWGLELSPFISGVWHWILYFLGMAFRLFTGKAVTNCIYNIDLVPKIGSGDLEEGKTLPASGFDGNCILTTVNTIA